MDRTSPRQAAVFISYRRDDAASEARAVRDAVDRAFGTDAAFFDTNTRLGAEWPSEIQTALAKADTVLAVIGSGWVTAADRWGRPGSTTRVTGFARSWRPRSPRASGSSRCLVGMADVPPPEALPSPLKKLSALQAIMLRRDFWDHDIRLLTVQLQEMHADGLPVPGRGWAVSCNANAATRSAG